jgi:transcriptional regulator with XRE-family HTH domain
MGKARRPKPERLAEKLLHIRTALGLSQNEMLKRLGYEEEFSRNYISAFELGTREPPLPVLLEYGRVANVYVDVLIDDELELPSRFPSLKKSEGVARFSSKLKR